MEEDEDAKLMYGIEKRMCRCCLNSSKSMVYAASVCQAIYELAGITVETSDGLPQWICTQCLALLRKAIRFRSKIRRNDSILRDYLAKCAPFPIDEQDPELTKHATQHLSETQILQFDTDKTKNGYHKVLQHVKTVAAVFDVECKIEYNESVVKLEQEYSDIEDDMPLLELRSNKEDFLLGDDGISKTTSKTVKRKKDSKSKKKKKKYQNESENDDESESDDESENQDGTFNDVSILEPLESADPLLESIEELNDLENIEINDESFRKGLKHRNQLKYISCYKKFLRWKKEKNITAFTENVFLTYFNELDLMHKPGSLLTKYSMLKTTLFAQKRINMGNYSKLRMFLNDRSKNFRANRTKVFKKEEIDSFVKTAPDNLYLSTKVALILGVCGGCMTPDLLNLTVNDVELHANLILVKVKDKLNRERSFMIPENYSEYVRKYMKLRPRRLEFDRFLVHYKNGVFAKTGMGKNKVILIAKDVATFLKLQNPEKYNNLAFKKTFYALFETKKGSANDLLLNETDSECENSVNESENGQNGSENGKDEIENREKVIDNENPENESGINNDTIAKMFDSVAKSPDRVNFNDCSIASFNDGITNSSNKQEDFNDKIANTRDAIANFNSEMVDSDDSMVSINEQVAKFSNENCNKTPTGRIIKVPEKSAKNYVRSYRAFARWMQGKSIKIVTEDIMIKYFKYLREEKKSRSLWNTFSKLRNTVLIRNNVDIKKFERLKQYLRSNRTVRKRRTSKEFTETEVEMFLRSAPDYNYLMMKVALVIGISGACTSQELTDLTTDCVKIKRKSIIVKIKTGSNKIRRFSISGDYYKYVKRDENIDDLNNLEAVVKKRSSIRKHLELDPEKIRVITLNPEEQIRQREEETKNLANFMYHCKLCFKGFNFESKLENHMAKHSPSRGKYLCTVCQMYLPTMYSYSVHMLIHTRRYECVKCQRRMIDRQSIYNHYRSQHEGITMIIKCDICGKESSNDKTHRSHMRNHHSGTRPECDQCGKTFINKDSLTEHILIHSGEKKYACPICDKRCRSRAHVKNHMKMHSDVKEFYCVECDVRFKSAHNLRVHLTKSLKHKDEMSFKFPCSDCPRRFESATRLSAHTRVQHLGVRAHACSSCGARLASRAGLVAHARAVHASRARPPPSHVCHACGRAFRGKSVLINHMRTHTGEKPYTCAVCARSFSQRTALRTHHKLVHLKVKHNNQKPQPPLIDKPEQLFPKSEPQPNFEAWSRPCELYYPAS